MLSKVDLKEYRLLRHLSLRDVARYCDVCHELIGQVERGEVGVTKYNHDQIIKGINGASQAIVDGTFNVLKEEECQKIREKRGKLKEKRELSHKEAENKRNQAKKLVAADVK